MQTAFSVTVSERSDPFLIRVSGEFDMAGFSKFESSLDGLWETPSAGVALDLVDVSFMDSSGIRGVLDVHDRCAEDGRSFAMQANETVMFVLNLTGLAEILGVASEQTAQHRH